MIGLNSVSRQIKVIPLGVCKDEDCYLYVFVCGSIYDFYLMRSYGRNNGLIDQLSATSRRCNSCNLALSNLPTISADLAAIIVM